MQMILSILGSFQDMVIKGENKGHERRRKRENGKRNLMKRDVNDNDNCDDDVDNVDDIDNDH